MSEKLYGKICYSGEGVVCQRKFNSEAEASAYVLGAKDMQAQIDPDGDDDHIAVTDDKEAVDE